MLSKMGWARLAIVALTAIYFIDLWMIWPDLPDQVASRFDAKGAPVGYTSRASLVGILGVVGVLIPKMGLFVPWLLRKLPDSMVNIPHREYYLAPERREQTLGDMEMMMVLFGIFTGLYLFSLSAVSLRYNTGAFGPQVMGRWILWGSLVYFAVVIAWLVVFLRRYRKLPEGISTAPTKKRSDRKRSS